MLDEPTSARSPGQSAGERHRHAPRWTADAVLEELKKPQEEGIATTELEKVKNKTESAMAFEDMSVMNRAASIAMYELLGDADLMNKELDKYRAVTAEKIAEQCKIIFNENNCSTMYYLSNN